jgi:hypothetical protein
MRPRITASSLGWCYLLHFASPLGNPEKARGMAQHYTGWAEDPIGDGAGLERRITQQLTGQGAKITRAAHERGVEVILVAAWRAPLSFEKHLKRRKDAPWLCPLCSAARGRRPRRVVVPAEQLTLPLFDQVEPWDDGDFPEPPAAAKMDTYEFLTVRRWRQAGAASALVAVGDICEDIPW